MDTTLEYTMMCSEATEIQDMWKFTTGDYFTSIPQAFYSGGNAFSIVDNFWHDDELTKQRKPYEWVWLPRQDQLQEMLAPTEPYRLFNKLYAFGERSHPAYSPEGLTLAYIMKTLYNKTWRCYTWRQQQPKQ